MAQLLTTSVTGSLYVSGVITAPSGITGTSSWASNAVTSSQGSKAWGNIICIGGTKFTSSTYGCSVNRLNTGLWGVIFNSASPSTLYSVCINAFSGSASTPTASVSYASGQTVNSFTMSFANVTTPITYADFATASFNVHSY